MAFLAFVHLALFLALSLSPGNSLVSSWCDHSIQYYTIPGYFQRKITTAQNSSLSLFLLSFPLHSSSIPSRCPLLPVLPSLSLSLPFLSHSFPFAFAFPPFPSIPLHKIQPRCQGERWWLLQRGPGVASHSCKLSLHTCAVRAARVGIRTAHVV